MCVQGGESKGGLFSITIFKQNSKEPAAQTLQIQLLRNSEYQMLKFQSSYSLKFIQDLRLKIGKAFVKKPRQQ